MLTRLARATARTAARTRQAAVDGTCWTAALILAGWLRFEFSLPDPYVRAILVTAPLAAAVHTALGLRLGLYRKRFIYGSFDEVRASATAAGSTAVLLLASTYPLPGRPLPTSTPLFGGTLAIVGMLAIRYLHRLRSERRMRPSSAAATPVLVFGAGSAGCDLVRSMLRDPRGPYLPVGMLDDDPDKRQLRVHGVRVLGRLEDLAEVATRTQVSVLVLAIPSANPAVVRRTRAVATEAGLSLKVLPSVKKLLDRPVAVSDVRDISITDLLGRGQIETDLPAIAGYLTGRRVLVTGAGGSIGSELCRQLHRFAPAELMMLDRDESALHAVQLSIHDRALLDHPDILLADLRDAPRIRTIFAERRPEVVFHAAALKHQPLLEQYPSEALMTNVWGTATVLEAAADYGTSVLVNISTDKAADPSSVLGYSKRAAERMTSHVARTLGRRYMSVRFGNVLGSRGSVLTTFTSQIAAGKPVTVTDPDVTRYFMTVHEAVQLVIQAGAVGGAGEALILDMGEPVRITDLARQVAALAHEPIDIVYTGLRPGEKLHECLFGAGEHDIRHHHPLISQVPVPPLAPGLTRLVSPQGDRDTLLRHMVAFCDPAVTEVPVSAEGRPAAESVNAGVSGRSPGLDSGTEQPEFTIRTSGDLVSQTSSYIYDIDN